MPAGACPERSRRAGMTVLNPSNSKWLSTRCFAGERLKRRGLYALVFFPCGLVLQIRRIGIATFGRRLIGRGGEPFGSRPLPRGGAGKSSAFSELGLAPG